MKKYFYFGVFCLKEVTDATGRTRKMQVAIWGKPYASPQDALRANAGYIVSHLGERFTVQGFEKRLKLGLGNVAEGFEEEQQ